MWSLQKVVHKSFISLLSLLTLQNEGRKEHMHYLIWFQTFLKCEKTTKYNSFLMGEIRRLASFPQRLKTSGLFISKLTWSANEYSLTYRELTASSDRREITNDLNNFKQHLTIIKWWHWGKCVDHGGSPLTTKQTWFSYNNLWAREHGRHVILRRRIC